MLTLLPIAPRSPSESSSPHRRPSLIQTSRGGFWVLGSGFESKRGKGGLRGALVWRLGAWSTFEHLCSFLPVCVTMKTSPWSTREELRQLAGPVPASVSRLKCFGLTEGGPCACQLLSPCACQLLIPCTLHFPSHCTAREELRLTAGDRGTRGAKGRGRSSPELRAASTMSSCSRMVRSASRRPEG